MKNKTNYLVTGTCKECINLIGAKGENLQKLMELGFNVPETYYLSLNAYTSFLQDAGLNQEIKKVLVQKNLTARHKSDWITDSIYSSKISPGIIYELENNHVINTPDQKWAVRSSSNLEDLAGASFAGLYDSYLDIRGLNEIVDAIKKCWASLWSERAIVYREEKKINHLQAKMGVIIQQMVDAEYAGVLFTKEPGRKKSNEMILEYCKGNGEGLVSGEITPFSCRIDTFQNNIEYLSYPDNETFRNIQINNLVSEAVKIEQYFGSPQDIEWAYDGNDIYFLQTRPITETCNVREKKNEIVWTRANIGEVLPEVITPLTWDIFRATIMNRPEFALSPERDTEINQGDGIKLIRGRGYIRLDNFLNSFCYLPFVTPEVMTSVLGVNLPPESESYSRPTGFFVNAAQCLFFLNSAGIVPRLLRMADKMPKMPVAVGLESLEDLILWNAQCFKLHLKCTAYNIGSFAVLEHLLFRWIPKEAESLLPEILTGHENLQTAAQGISLWNLAKFANNDQSLKIILKQNFNTNELNRKLSGIKAGPELMELVNEFLDKNGARAAGEFELSVSRWREDPSFVFSIIRSYMEIQEEQNEFFDPDRQRERQQKAVNKITGLLGFFKAGIFLKLLGFYRDNSTLRENIKYRLMEGYFQIRQIFFKTGKQFVERGIIKYSNDIFFMTPSEVLEVNNGKISVTVVSERISKRKEEYEGFKLLDAPQVIVGDDKTSAEFCADQMAGVGCSPGIAEGRARVLLSINDSDTLKPGEILVTPHTDPGWTPLFLRCSAVVTEIGGFLSHGATVAREYGIPAVVNVAGATSKIRTGDTINVNGVTGKVYKCS